LNYLIVNQLTKSYRRYKVLDGIRLMIEPGVFGILGSKNAGKTTLIRTIATVVAPDMGDIVYGELNWRKDMNKIREMIGYLPQQIDFQRKISILNWLLYMATIKGLKDKSKREKEVERVLHVADLLHEKHTLLNQMSDGLKQRVGIAQALINDPPILLLDSPTSKLGMDEKIHMRSIIRSLSKEKTIIIASNNMEDIAILCQKFAILKNGAAYSFNHLEDIAKEATGLVWKCHLSLEEYGSEILRGELLSVAVTTDQVEVRILANEQPHPLAIVASPTMEEGYLIWNRKN